MSGLLAGRKVPSEVSQATILHIFGELCALRGHRDSADGCSLSAPASRRANDTGLRLRLRALAHPWSGTCACMCSCGETASRQPQAANLRRRPVPGIISTRLTVACGLSAWSSGTTSRSSIQRPPLHRRPRAHQHHPTPALLETN